MDRMRDVWRAWNSWEQDIPQTPLPEITTNSSTWDWWFNNSNGLPAVNEWSVMSISAAYACVNLISGAISSLPMHLYHRTPEGERDQLQNDDLWWLLNEEFLPRWSAANGWEYLCQSLLFHGDAFAGIIRKDNRIVGLEPLHPNNVVVAVTPDRMRLVYAVTRAQGAYDVVDQDDMLHIAGFGFNGFRGVSPLRHVLTTSAGVALATQDYAGRFFANSARPDIVLSTDQAIGPDKAEEIKEAWKRNYQGVQNAHKPAVVGMGVKIQQLTMTSEDAQLLATRQFQIEEIARAYGVPPFMIGHTEKTTSWGSGVETMGTGFVRFTLRQHLHKFQTEINRKFFRTSSRFAEFDTFELEKADMAQLFTSFSTALGNGGAPAFMTANEVRMKLNLKKNDGGDTLSTGAINAPQQAT